MRTNLSLKQLEVLLAIVDHGNFSAAAEHLFVSQPALSRTVRLAEDNLGARIFDRDTRQVSLTPAGEELVPIARRVLDEFNDSMGELSQFMEGKRGRVRVSAVPSMAQSLLLEVVSLYSQAHPGVGFMLRVDTAEQILALLDRKETDVGLSAQPPPDGRFNYRHLQDDNFVLICPSDDPLAKAGSANEPLDWSVFASRPFIAVTPGSNTRAATDAAFMEAGVTVRPTHEVASTNLPLIGGLIAAGLGLSALPASTLSCLVQPTLVARPLARPTMRRRIGIVTLAGRTLSVSAQRFCEYIEQAAHKSQ